MLPPHVLSSPSQPLQEPELVHLLKVRHPGGMDYLYQNYAQTLFGVALQVVKTQEVAEEVMQDALIRIWSRIEGYDDSKGRLYTWMYTLTRNLALDQLRSRSLIKEGQTVSIRYHEHTVDQNHHTMPSIDQIGVKELLRQLKPEYRVILEMLYLKGYSHSEVAEELDIPLGTVKSRVRSSIRQLRKTLNV